MTGSKIGEEITGPEVFKSTGFSIFLAILCWNIDGSRIDSSEFPDVAVEFWEVWAPWERREAGWAGRWNRSWSCDEDEATAGYGALSAALRWRARLVSVWNGTCSGIVSSLMICVGIDVSSGLLYGKIFDVVFEFRAECRVKKEENRFNRTYVL